MISISETSDSSEINFAFPAPKRARHQHTNALVGCCDNKFKGIVPQQNGHWGAQIYSNHHRIWLGTFKSQTEAAMAYDSATIKLRSGQSHRNFPWNDQTVQEPLFQSHYSIETVLTMIRNGTYQTKFSTFLMSTQKNSLGISNKHLSLKGSTSTSTHEQFSCTHLFHKELTPSDVGKLNRLVIPKKHAVTYFPSVCGGGGEMVDGVDVEVVFYDKLMRVWKFRYCYWKSSQSYVLTRGWNRFVKDKKLKARDIIEFYMCEPISYRGQVFSLIDVIYNNNTDDTKQCVDETQNLGNKLSCSDQVEDQDQETKDRKDELNPQRGLRLFGVSIN